MTKLWNLDVIQAKTPNTILSSPRANFLRAVWHWRAEIEKRERGSGDGISEKFGVKKGRGGEGFVSVRCQWLQMRGFFFFVLFLSSLRVATNEVGKKRSSINGCG